MIIAIKSQRLGQYVFLMDEHRMTVPFIRYHGAVRILVNRLLADMRYTRYPNRQECEKTPELEATFLALKTLLLGRRPKTRQLMEASILA